MIIFILLLLNLYPVSPPASIYDFKPKLINGTEFDFSACKGKMILIVNTASQCGYTPQYTDLEKLAEQYRDQLIILGFPANNFGKQEPGTNEQIATFCKSEYSISFPMMQKVSVKGPDIDPLFAWLIEQPNPDFTGDIKWNFEKFLIDKDGNLIRRFRSGTEPFDEKIISLLEGK